MKLKPEIEKLDEIDKSFHPLYTESNGKFVFSGLDGYEHGSDAKLKKALDTERGNAQKYANELKPYRTLFGDKKPEEIQAQLDSIEELKLAAKGKLDESAIEERVNARLEAKVRPHQRKLTETEERLKAAETKVAEYETRERRAKVHSAIREAALASGALPESYAEGGGLLAVLEGVLEVTEDGSVRSKDGAGYPSGLDVAKLLQQVQGKQGYFWGTSKGGGSDPRGGNKGGGGVVKGNPWKKETRNLTEQMRISRENPPEAERLKREAGIAPS